MASQKTVQCPYCDAFFTFIIINKREVYCPICGVHLGRCALGVFVKDDTVR